MKYGRLHIDRSIGDEWGYLFVDGDIRERYFEVLGLGDMGYEIPEYEAHISAFTDEQVKRLPDRIQAQDKWYGYTPTHIQVVDPEDWEQVNSCVILCVQCKALEQLRQSLGFTPLMYGKHKFHITIGIRAQDIDKETLEGIKMFNMKGKVNKIASKVYAFNYKNFIKITKNDLDKPSKDLDIRKQDTKDLPLYAYIQYPKKEDTFKIYHVFWITDRMRYAEIEFCHSESEAKRFVDNLITKYERMAEGRKQRREQRVKFKHDLKVGDVLYSSWGYDQTNVDFYVVKEVGQKSVKIVEIGQKVVDGDIGNEYVVPVMKQTGRVMTKQVRPGNRINLSSYATAWKWDGKPKRQTNPYCGH